MRLIYGMLICVLFCVVLTPLTAGAQGVLFVEKETRDGQSSTNQIQIDKTHMRAESRASGDQMAFVFDAQAQTARMINSTKKTYMEMTKSDLEQTRQQMGSAMAQLQEQLKNLPPAQRQMIEQQMQGRGGFPGLSMAQAPKPEYRAAGSDKVGQWACMKYEAYAGQQKTAEICTVDPKEFGLTAADFDVARQFAEFMKSLMPEGADRLLVNGTPDAQGFSGIPVRRISFRNGAVESTSEMTEFRREAFPASTFDVPAGFRKEAMPGARR